MPGVHVVVQRCDEASLLIDNVDDWVTIDKGLVVYVSFAKIATAADVDKAVQTILSVPLMPSEQGVDQTKPIPAVALIQEGQPVNILVIPQASLVSKARGKTLQYHDQISFAEGRALFERFVAGLRSPAPLPGKGGGKSKPQGVRGGEVVDPALYFKSGQFKGAYARYDERGVPTHAAPEEEGAEEKELSKNQKKKVEKYYKLNLAKWEKAQASVQEVSAAKGDDDAEKGPKASQCDEGEAVEEQDGGLKGAAAAVGESRAPSSGEDAGGVAGLHVVAGTFGNRQGIRMASAGPFTHTFIF